MPAPPKQAQQFPEGDAVISHDQCWAKTTADGNPGICVRDHCLNVGCVAEALIALLSNEMQQLVPPGAAALAALHDVGKVSPGFQLKSDVWLVQRALSATAQNAGWAVCERDHAKISQSTVQNLLGDSRLYGWAAAVGAHHGRVKGQRINIQEPWEQERVRLAAELIEKFGLFPDQPPDDATTWFLAGLISVADWIGSNEAYFPQTAQWDMPERRTQARTALSRVGWKSIRAKTQLKAFSDLFPKVPCANSLQVATMDTVHDPGIYIVEGPMGYGKTEAALAAAYHLIATEKASGVYFALPTQVTSNRIHLRVQPFVDRISIDPAEVRLTHGTSWLAETGPAMGLHPSAPNDPEALGDARAERSWFASAKRALLAPFGVGTIDQALLSVVAARHFFVRRFGLAGKVVILDEVHSYDLYTGTLVGVLVKRLRELRSTVMILSATLTEKRRRELLGLAADHPVSRAYPLVSGATNCLIERACEPPPPKTVFVRAVSGAVRAEDVLRRAAHGDCVLWLRNTVGEAQETYRALRSESGTSGPRIALLHSRFPFFRREQLETEWISRLGKDSRDRPAGCVLVSTQVAEQSVDIDADLLITDLAPTDMLLQRLGRLWRHERPGRPCSQPEVWIQTPDIGADTLRVATARELVEALGKSARVYAPYVLLRSLEQWRGKAAITLPGDIREVLEATYADPPSAEPAAWGELRQRLENQKEKLARLALNSTTVWTTPSLEDEEGVQTRYTTYETGQLLLATEITPVSRGAVRLGLLNGDVVMADGREWSFDAAKAIHLNLARVPRWTLAAGLHEKMPTWLANHVSQPTAAGLLQPDETILWPGRQEPTGLSYDPDQGIVIKRERQPAHEEFDESYD